MPTAIQPMIDAIADFFYFCSYPKAFSKPVAVLPDDDKFNLTHQIEKWLDVRPGSIAIEAVNVKNADPLGLVLMKDDGATIRYSLDIHNTCYKRLVIAKELCHLIIKKLEYEDRIDVPALLLAVTRRDGAFGCYDTDTADGRVETLSHFLSEQLLVPWFENDYIRKSPLSNYELALQYRAPEFIIEYRRAISSGTDLFEDDITRAYNNRCP